MPLLYQFEKVSSLLNLIKFSHTIFSLPFAIMSTFLAANGMPEIRQLLLIIAALVTARSAAMSFNRLVDKNYDMLNPRTRYRAVLLNKIGKKNIWLFTTLSVMLVITFAWLLNNLAFYMSPIAILIIFGYSYTKRFTYLSHVVLGLALALSPLGAWIAIKGTLSVTPLLLALAVILWTGGFDIIYACQDMEFDTKTGLYSIPKRFGIRGALIISGVLHFLMVLVLVIIPVYTDLGLSYKIGVCITGALLFYEHSLVKPKDLSKINTAFFTINGIISLGLMGITLIDIFLT